MTHRVQIERGCLSIPATHLEESVGRLLLAQPVNILSIPLDPAMQKIVEVRLAFSRRQCYLQQTCWTKSPLIFAYKRNIALKRVAFGQCEKSAGETFEDFYIRLRSLAEAADVCARCLDTRMTTRVMAGICNPGIQHEKEATGPESIP